MDGQSAAVQKRSPDHSQLTAHYGWVRAVARNLVRDPWGAEDVTQETLLAALASPPRDVPDEQRMRAWLGRVAFNLSRLGARQGARRHAREVRVARREALPSVTDELESAGTLQALSGAIAALAEPYRSVIAMRYFDGLSTAEIAARTSSSELAVRKRLWRARNKLRAALEHDPVSGRLLAAIFSWSWFARRARSAGLGTVAAGVALVAGATWWGGGVGRELSPHVAALGATAPGELELATLPDSGATPEPDEEPRSLRSRMPVRRPAPPPFVPPAPPSDGVAERPAAFAQGLVLDLEGQARAGLELFDPAAPAEVLATSDALGGFAVPVRAEAWRLEARAPGWTTIVSARITAGAPTEPLPLVVARAQDLFASVHAESGRVLPEAEVALCCDERAFVRIPLPVRLDGAQLWLSGADGMGRIRMPDLPRGTGLTLHVRAPGFETLELDTPALGGEERFFLRPLGEARLLAGRVLYRDGRPVAGANVSLGLATTTADELGRYRLPLYGVHPDTNLEARDPFDGAARAELRAFGARLGAGFEEVDLVLGEEHDPVAGKLVGEDPAGWLVVAYPRADPEVDAQGDEVPAGSTRSAADGSFAFRLPRGAYDLYAVAPGEPRLVRREALETRQGLWRLELHLSAALQGFHAELRTADGLLLAHAGVVVHLLLEGELGPRRLTWKALTADDQGGVAFARDPSARLELALAHAAVGERIVALSAPGASQQLVVPRSAWLQVAGAASTSSASVLDAHGRVLAVRGPLQASEHFALHSGRSPVLEVPLAARWLALAENGTEPVLVSIEPRAGTLLQVRP